MKRLLLLSLLLCGLLPPAAQAQTLVPTGTPHQFWYLDNVFTSTDDSLLYRSGIGSWPELSATFLRVTTNEADSIVYVSTDAVVVKVPQLVVRGVFALKPKATTATLEEVLHDAVWRACADSLGVDPDSLGWASRTQ